MYFSYFARKYVCFRLSSSFSNISLILPLLRLTYGRKLAWLTFTKLLCNYITQSSDDSSTAESTAVLFMERQKKTEVSFFATQLFSSVKAVVHVTVAFK
jgi:hypothetical protein